jgi:hypothetical protein
MKPPKLEKIITDAGILYRVSYAGMVKDHKHDWQAINAVNNPSGYAVPCLDHYCQT